MQACRFLDGQLLYNRLELSTLLKALQRTRILSSSARKLEQNAMQPDASKRCLGGPRSWCSRWPIMSIGFTVPGGTLYLIKDPILIYGS